MAHRSRRRRHACLSRVDSAPGTAGGGGGRVSMGTRGCHDVARGGPDRHRRRRPLVLQLHRTGIPDLRRSPYTFAAIRRVRHWIRLPRPAHFRGGVDAAVERVRAGRVGRDLGAPSRRRARCAAAWRA